MKGRTKRLLRNFLLELILYGALLAAYFFFVLRFLRRPLFDLFHLNPLVYAGATLILIVVQSVLLERVTSYLIRWLGLERVE
jgi:hypothetical protein